MAPEVEMPAKKPRGKSGKFVKTGRKVKRTGIPPRIAKKIGKKS
jgi:hypothetical protein